FGSGDEGDDPHAVPLDLVGPGAVVGGHRRRHCLHGSDGEAHRGHGQGSAPAKKSATAVLKPAGSCRLTAWPASTPTLRRVGSAARAASASGRNCFSRMPCTSSAAGTSWPKRPSTEVPSE